MLVVLRRGLVPPAGLLSVLALMAVAVVGLASPARVGAGSCVVAAHRGYAAHTVENSMGAFRRALFRRADFLEMDVQVTRDGRFVLMHDQTITRTTDGTGRVIGRTWRQLRQVRLTNGERVPSLGAVLRLVKPTRAKVMLELKWVPSDRFPALRRVLGRFGVRRVVVNSFSAAVMTRFHERYPGVPAALDVDRPISVARARWFGGVMPDHRHSSDRWLARLRAAHVRTYLWALDKPSQWAHYRGRVTLVLTNRVAEYDAWRRRHCR